MDEIVDQFCHFVMSAYHNNLLSHTTDHDYKKFDSGTHPNFTSILKEDIGHRYSGMCV